MTSMNTYEVPPQVREALNGIIPEDAMLRWWITPIPAWEGTTPAAMWRTSHLAVITLAEGYHDTSYS